MFDIGGGSTELVIGHGDRLDFHVSTQAGVVRQADRHITIRPADRQRNSTAVAEDVRAVLDAGRPAAATALTPGRALGVAGTPTSLAAIAQDLDPYDPERVHGYVLTADERDADLRAPAPRCRSQQRQRGHRPSPGPRDRDPARAS